MLNSISSSAARSFIAVARPQQWDEMDVLDGTNDGRVMGLTSDSGVLGRKILRVISAFGSDRATETLVQ
jgi:hypothetical protein